MIVHADTHHLPIRNNSVDLIVTSPPYWGQRSYTDNGRHYDDQIGAESTTVEYVDNLIACTSEWMRVLKPAGNMWVNLGDRYNSYEASRGDGKIQTNRARPRVERGHGLADKTTRNKSLMGLPWRYALRCVDDLRLILRAEVIWSKRGGLPESVRDRVRRSHETWFHMTLNPRHYANTKGVREVEGRIPGSVWETATASLRVPTNLGVQHHAMFPPEWPRRIIAGWSPVGGTVLDPFGGTGTTALVADLMGRRGVSVDMSADYCRLAKWRVNDSREREKVVT